MAFILDVMDDVTEEDTFIIGFIKPLQMILYSLVMLSLYECLKPVKTHVKCKGGTFRTVLVTRAGPKSRSRPGADPAR